MNRKELLTYVKTLLAEKGSYSSLGVTLLDDFRIATESPEVAVMLVGAAYHCINSSRKSPAFNSA